MKNLDNWILVIIAFCSVISPVLTTYINIRCSIKMRKLDEKAKLYENVFLHKRQIILDYLSAVGKIIHNGTNDEYSEYGKCYLRALALVDSKTAIEYMILINSIVVSPEISNDQLNNLNEYLEQLIPHLRLETNVNGY